MITSSKGVISPKFSSKSKISTPKGVMAFGFSFGFSFGFGFSFSL
jgi:hypothetical protein